jgi:hypothetical protein
MKAVLLGTDLLRHSDGTYKVLEINTNTSVHSEIVENLDKTSLKNLLQANNISEFHLIFNADNFVAATKMYADLGIPVSDNPTNPDAIAAWDSHLFGFKYYCQSIASEIGATFVEHEVLPTAVTIPSIEDAPNKFILRMAYDMTALIDEEYAKDKVKFNKLIENKPYALNSYHESINQEFNINNLTSVQVGVGPNVAIKSRYPNYDAYAYPTLYQVQNSEDLESLKSQISGSANEYMEEFINDDFNTVSGKTAVVRSLDIVYGGNLDVLNIGVYRMSTIVTRSVWPDEYISGSLGKLAQSSRPKWLTKWGPFKFDDAYVLDDNTKIIKSDGTLTLPSDLTEFESVMTIKLPWIPEDEVNFRAELSTGSFNSDAENFTTASTVLQSLISHQRETVMLEVTLDNGVVYQDNLGSVMMIERHDTEATTLTPTNRFRVNDKLVVFNYATNTLEKATITSLEPKFVSRTIYDVNVEPSDIFLPVIDEVNNLALVQHNQCWGWCQSWHCSSWSCNTCGNCGGGFQKL